MHLGQLLLLLHQGLDLLLLHLLLQKLLLHLLLLHLLLLLYLLLLLLLHHHHLVHRLLLLRSVRRRPERHSLLRLHLPKRRLQPKRRDLGCAQRRGWFVRAFSWGLEVELLDECVDGWVKEDFEGLFDVALGFDETGGNLDGIARPHGHLEDVLAQGRGLVGRDDACERVHCALKAPLGLEVAQLWGLEHAVVHAQPAEVAALLVLAVAAEETEALVQRVVRVMGDALVDDPAGLIRTHVGDDLIGFGVHRDRHQSPLAHGGHLRGAH
mmetsp:Transcript_25324/g.54933  ORF Transcript_25324/g.54933 Transcript_25324/m.54933 type:complete len:268 (+) Transcript_25324:904-1707(+)